MCDLLASFRKMIAFLFLCSLVSVARGANILLISTVCSPSHSLWCNKLAKLLIDNNHEVTILDSIDWKTTTPNLTRIFLEGAYVYPLTDMEGLTADTSAYYGIDLLYSASVVSCRNQLKSPGSAEFLRSIETKQIKPFDLVIHDGANCESFLGYVHKLGYPPLVQATAFGKPQGMLNFAGDPDNPSYVPSSMAAMNTPMNFYERFLNTIINAYDRFAYWKYLGEQNAMAREFFGEPLPPLEDIARNTSLFIINNHPILDNARSYVPAVIPIAGLHIDRSTKPMNEDLKDFLDSAQHGAIYFSLGTNILSSNMDDAKRDMFLKAFGELPQRVLWKWEKDDIPSKPPNVMISKWFPQSQILAHPNVKLYISHGGLLGTQEAIYHGVPLVVIPFFIDQHAISEELVRKQVAVKLTYPKLTKDTIKSAIHTVIGESSYGANIKKLSFLFRDSPHTPQEKILFWIEYVLRHGNISHLRSPTVQMQLHQILLLDVFLFVAAISVGVLALALIAVRKAKCLFANRKKASRKSKQQ